MDFSKAFDTVPHNRLLNKLNRYGIHNKTHTGISKFLKCRKQRVIVSGEHSTWTNVVSGVPQGTVLELLLFLVYINDLPDNIVSGVPQGTVLELLLFLVYINDLPDNIVSGVPQGTVLELLLFLDLPDNIILELFSWYTLMIYLTIFTP